MGAGAGFAWHVVCLVGSHWFLEVVLVAKIDVGGVVWELTLAELNGVCRCRFALFFLWDGFLTAGTEVVVLVSQGLPANAKGRIFWLLPELSFG